MKFHYVRQDLIEVQLNDVCIPINMNSGKSLIFIGSRQLSDQPDSIPHLMIGKIFQEESEFKEVIAQIQKSVELFQFFDQPLYVDVNHDIDVTITERENNVLIEMNFGGSYKIAGITDNKSEGFQLFESQFEKHKELRIHLESSTESFEIPAIKNVSLNLM